MLHDHLFKSTSNTKYICPQSQNETIDAIGNVATLKLVEQINAAQYMTK